MKKLLIPLLATAALALPAAAFAHGNHHHGHGLRFAAFKRGDEHAVNFGNGLFARLSGTGTSFGGAAATSTGSIVKGSPLGAGTYSASISTDWAHATSKTFPNGMTVSCAAATATLTLTDSASSANTESSTLTGKTCSWTSSGKTSYAFFAGGTVTGAGTLAMSVSGNERALLKEDSTGAVSGAVFGGFRELKAHLFVKLDGDDHQGGGCDH